MTRRFYLTVIEDDGVPDHLRTGPKPMQTFEVRCDRCRHHDDTNTSNRHACAVLERRYGSPDPRLGIITTPPDFGCVWFDPKDQQG